jgi:hypothetical protein
VRHLVHAHLPTLQKQRKGRLLAALTSRCSRCPLPVCARMHAHVKRGRCACRRWYTQSCFGTRHFFPHVRVHPHEASSSGGAARRARHFFVCRGTCTFCTRVLHVRCRGSTACLLTAVPRAGRRDGGRRREGAARADRRARQHVTCPTRNTSSRRSRARGSRGVPRRGRAGGAATNVWRVPALVERYLDQHVSGVECVVRGACVPSPRLQCAL